MRALVALLVRRSTMPLFPAAVPALLASPAIKCARDLSRAAMAPAQGLHRRPGRREERCLVLARAASSSSSKSKQMFVCSGCGEQQAQW